MSTPARAEAGPGPLPTRLRAPLGTAAVVGLATAALRLRDPHRHGSWGWCPFKLLTGWDCPACGGLRAVNDLTHGDLVAAWHSNALFVAALPAIVVAWLVWVRRSMSGPPPVRRDQWGPRAQLALAVGGLLLVAGFTVWRNTPWGSAFHVT